MLTDDLFQKVLIAPAQDKSINRLQIVSGFATASMADRHMKALRESIGRAFHIDLIIGMAHRMGMQKTHHYEMQKLARENAYRVDFSCRYIAQGRSVHAKTYCWLADDTPKLAFTGSANYTQNAFSTAQIEAMVADNPEQVTDFYQSMMPNTVDCLSADVTDTILLTEKQNMNIQRGRAGTVDTPQPDSQDDQDSQKPITLSLLVQRTGETPERSGINWGQRQGRDKDQAYIPIPAPIASGDFFPPRPQTFTVLTDDGESFIMVRAQDNQKALHTTQSNALLGFYLRQRMGLPSGIYVTRQHLEDYGRSDVSFTKIDDETYLMDFGVQ